MRKRKRTGDRRLKKKITILPGAVEGLASGIIKQASTDFGIIYMNGEYPDTRHGMTNKGSMKEITNFFHSEWFLFLVGDKIDGDRVMRGIKMKKLKEMIDFYEAYLAHDQRATISISLMTTKTKPYQKVVIPGRLVKDFDDLIDKQCDELKQELKKLEKEEAGEKDEA